VERAFQLDGKEFRPVALCIDPLCSEALFALTVRCVYRIDLRDRRRVQLFAGSAEWRGQALGTLLDSRFDDAAAMAAGPVTGDLFVADCGESPDPDMWEMGRILRIHRAAGRVRCWHVNRIRAGNFTSLCVAPDESCVFASSRSGVVRIDAVTGMAHTHTHAHAHTHPQSF
jgi:hypothetical protein